MRHESRIVGKQQQGRQAGQAQLEPCSHGKDLVTVLVLSVANCAVQTLPDNSPSHDIRMRLRTRLHSTPSTGTTRPYARYRKGAASRSKGHLACHIIVRGNHDEEQDVGFEFLSPNQDAEVREESGNFGDSI